MPSSVSAWCSPSSPGFNTDWCASAVTILAYVVAAPIAMWAMSAACRARERQPRLPRWRRTGLVVLRHLSVCRHGARKAGAGGGRRGHPEHQAGHTWTALCGAVLWARVRVGLIAVTVVLVVDQLLAPRRLWQRARGARSGSQLRPWLAPAG